MLGGKEKKILMYIPAYMLYEELIIYSHGLLMHIPVYVDMLGGKEKIL
jgi:hypothetical protein